MESLDFSYNEIDSSCAKDFFIGLESLSSLKVLKVTTVFNNKFEMSKMFCNSLKNLKNLESLDFSLNQIDSSFAKDFCIGLESLSSLKVLKVCKVFKDNFEMSKMFSVSLKNLKILESLNFRGNIMRSSFSEDFFVGLESSASTFKRLDFSNCFKFLESESQIFKDSFTDLANCLPKFTKLENLDLSNCNLASIDSSIVKKLITDVKKNCHSLISFNLQDNKLIGYDVQEHFLSNFNNNIKPGTWDIS